SRDPRVEAFQHDDSGNCQCEIKIADRLDGLLYDKDSQYSRKERREVIYCHCGGERNMLQGIKGTNQTNTTSYTTQNQQRFVVPKYRDMIALKNNVRRD